MRFKLFSSPRVSCCLLLSTDLAQQRLHGVCQHRGEEADRIRVHHDAEDDEDAHRELLQVSHSRDIAIPDCRDGRDHIVDCHKVHAAMRDFLEVSFGDLEAG